MAEERSYSAADVERVLYPHKAYFHDYQRDRVGDVSLVFGNPYPNCLINANTKLGCNDPASDQPQEVEEKDATKTETHNQWDLTEDREDCNWSDFVGVSDQQKFHSGQLLGHFCVVEILNVHNLWYAHNVGLEKSV